MAENNEMTPVKTAKFESLAPAERKVRMKTILEQMVPDFKTILRGVDPKVLVYAVMNSIAKTPKLLDCTQKSLLRSVVYLAQIQLMPDTPDQHAHLIPYGTECQVIVNYQGYIELAHRSGRVETIYAHLVYENDEFDEVLGTERKLHHKPFRGGDRGKIIGAYAVARLLNGGVEWEYMTWDELEKVRNCSKAKDKPGSPWIVWKEQMYQIRPIRRLRKRIPTTPQMSLAAALDDKFQMGESQEGLGETEYEILDEEGKVEQPPPAETKSDKMAKKFEKKNGKPPATKPEPEPEPKTGRTPSRMELEAELFSLIAENEDMLKSVLGEESEVFKYTNKQVAGWTVDGVQTAIAEIKRYLNDGESEEPPELELGAQ